MILILLLFIFVSLFILFITSRHDFVLLRQNISIRFIFDKALIIVLFSLLISRSLYLIDENLYDFFLDPLSFMHIVLFYGFSFLGFFSAFALGVVFFFKDKKNLFRILDIYLLSFYPLIVFEGISYLILGKVESLILFIYMFIATIIFFVLVKMHTGFGIRDGVVAFCILTLSALSYLGYSIYRKQELLIYSPVQILAIIVLAISIYCLILIRIDFFKEK